MILKSRQDECQIAEIMNLEGALISQITLLATHCFIYEDTYKLDEKLKSRASLKGLFFRQLATLGWLCDRHGKCNSQTHSKTDDDLDGRVARACAWGRGPPGRAALLGAQGSSARCQATLQGGEECSAVNLYSRLIYFQQFSKWLFHLWAGPFAS